MNSKFLLSLSLFLSSWFMASANGKLSFNAPNRTLLKVVIDGRKFYSNNNNLAIRNLNSGSHTITIYTLKGNEYNDFYTNGNSNRWRRISTKQVIIRNNYLYDVTINRFGRVFYDQDYIYNNSDWGWGRRDNTDDEEDFIDNEVDFDNGFDENYKDIDFFRRPNQTGGPRGGIFGSNGINTNSFNKLKETAQNQILETSRLNFLKQNVGNNLFSNSQITELAQTLNMETSKLEFLKHAFSSSTNKNEYFVVCNTLSMQSSKDDLMEYIKNRR